MNNYHLTIFGLLSIFFIVGTGFTQIEAIWPDPMPLEEPYFVDQDTTVDVSSLNLGVAAGYQTWVFTNTIAGEITQSDWLEVEGTPYDTAFTEADWVEHFWQYAPRIEFNVQEDWKITVLAQMVEMFRYHNHQEDWIRTLGMGFDYDLMWGAPYVYDAPSFYYPETLTVSTDPWLEMYSFETKLLALFPSTVTDSTWIEVDAWGELTIPAGTFNCIRIKRHEFRNIYVQAFDTTAQLETYTYTWFTEGYQPLLSISAQAIHSDTIQIANLLSRFKGYTENQIHSYALPPDETISPGDTVTLTISVDMNSLSNPDDKLGSFSGSLSWDTSILTYSSNSGIISGFTGIVNVEDSLISFNGANPSGMNGAFYVLAVSFEATAEGTTDLDLNYSAMAAATTFQNLLPDLIIHDGQVSVEQVEDVTLTMAVNSTEGGTTDPEVGNHEYPMGTEVGIEASPNIGYNFSHWEGNVTDTNDSSTTVIMDTDKALTAYFTMNPAVEIHSYASPSDEMISLGDTVTVTLSVDMSAASAPDDKLGSFSGSLTWDSSILAYIRNSGILSGFSGMVNPASSTLGFNGANPSGAGGNFDILQCG